MKNPTRMMQTGTHRTDVFAGPTRIGYIVRMLEGLPTMRHPATGKIINYMVSPEPGGLARAVGLGLSTAETEEEAITSLRKMAGYNT